MKIHPILPEENDDQGCQEEKEGKHADVMEVQEKKKLKEKINS